MKRYGIIFGSVAVLLLPGCVIVNPGDVEFAASPVSVQVPSPIASDPMDRYADYRERNLRQPAKVREALDERDWEDVIDEAADWTRYCRVLLGYSDQTHDPVKFRNVTYDLLRETESLRQAAVLRDVTGCERALSNADGLLDRMSRDFPISGRPTQTRPPQASRSASPSAHVP